MATGLGVSPLGASPLGVTSGTLEVILSDAILLTDALYKAVDVTVSDVFSVSDTAYKAVDVLIQDAISLTDDIPEYLEVLLSDPVNLTDSVSATLALATRITYMTPARVVAANQVITEYIDLFQGDGTTRLLGVIPANLTLRLFYGEAQPNWDILAGAGVPNISLNAGHIYWSEITPGFYMIRFHPNAVGFWRILLAHTTVPQEVSVTYDVVPDTSPAMDCIRASF